MSKREQLVQLKKRMKSDQKLPLAGGSNHLVFGEGDSEALVMFIGEGPGYWEDQKGRPFVGAAGKLLDKLLESIGIDRKDVFITNVVHHRPPLNRDPNPEEIEAYQPYLDKMIEIIDPKVVVTLGRFSMGKFLEGAKITQVHGQKFDVDWKGKHLTVFPMFHPAAALRSEEVRKKTYEDMTVLSGILRD